MRSCIVALLMVLFLIFSGCSMHVSGRSKGSIGLASLPALVTWDAEPVEVEVQIASPAADAIAAEVLRLIQLGDGSDNG